MRTVESEVEVHVEFMGGADAVVEKARGSFDEGDFRWAAEVLNHVVFAEPDHAAARERERAAAVARAPDDRCHPHRPGPDLSALAPQRRALPVTGRAARAGRLVLRLPMQVLLGLVSGQVGPDALEAAGVEVDGDPGILARLLSTLDEADPNFAIVTP